MGGRRRHTSSDQIEAMGHAIVDGSAEQLIGVCVTCEDAYWFPVDAPGEACPADDTEHRTHECNYYVLVGVTRQ